MKLVRAQSEVTVVCMCVRVCADMLEAIVFAVRRWRLVMGVFRLRTKYSVCRSLVIWIMFAECGDYFVNEAIDSYKFAPYPLKEL